MTTSSSKSLEEQLWAIGNYRVKWEFCSSYISGANKIKLQSHISWVTLGRSFIFPVFEMSKQSTGDICLKGLSQRLNEEIFVKIFLLFRHGLHPCLLHWQVGSLPLNHQGSPVMCVVLSKLLWWWPCWGPMLDCLQFSSVQSSVMSNSLRPHELQHARPPCPSPTPGVHSDSRPSSRWCHPAISSSVVPFFPSFPSQLEWKIGLAWANTRGILNSPS